MKQLIEVVPQNAETSVLATVLDFAFDDGKGPIPPTLTIHAKSRYHAVDGEFLVKFFGPDQLKNLPVIMKGSTLIISFETGKRAHGVDPFWPNVSRMLFGTKIRQANTMTIN